MGDLPSALSFVKTCLSCGTKYSLASGELRGRRLYCTPCKKQAAAAGCSICVHTEHVGTRFVPVNNFYRNAKDVPMSYCIPCHRLTVSRRSKSQEATS